MMPSLQESLGGMKIADESGKDGGSGVFSQWMDDLDTTYQPPHPLDQSSTSDKLGLNRFENYVSFESVIGPKRV